jgi:peptide/nickel transport system substrate-binding protein
MAVAMNRAELRTIGGGSFAGDLADGLIKPTLAQDYKPTNMWGGLLGQTIPDTGDPEYAKKLIADSGQPMPEITLDYANTPTNTKYAASIVGSLGKAGIKVRPNPIEPGTYYGIVLDPAKAHHLMTSGWAPDWINASTVIPELITPSGGFNLSQWDDAAFNAKVEAAKTETDRTKQGQLWADLNTEAMKQVPVIPTRFDKTQYLVGSKVGGAYLWFAYGSLPYGALWVKK